MSELFLVFQILLLPFLVLASDSAGANSDIDFSILKKPGMPLLMQWKDGREAALKLIGKESAVISTTFKIVENTCSNRQGMSCRYRFSLRKYWAGMIWTKHSDANRVGYVVEKMVPEPGKSEFKASKLWSDNLLHFGLDQKMKASQGLPVHEIECDDWSWLPNQPSNLPESIHIARWGQEGDLANKETKENENGTLGSALGVILTRTGNKSVRVSHIDALTGFTAHSDIPILTATSSLTLALSEDNICQVGITSNLLGDILPVLNSFPSQFERLSEADNHVFGSSEMLSKTFFGSELRSWFSRGNKEIRFQ